LFILPEYAKITPLELLELAMRHYASVGEWAAAASIAEKAARYRHAPMSTKQFGSNMPDDENDMLEEDYIPPRRGRPPKPKLG
jgi:hypothetical protein